MLKAHLENETWLVQQHHHAQVSGLLAAHWGGASGFARPGHYPGATHPDRWRDEVILAIAEHDNGWWETEAMPRFSDRDGLPVGVGEAASPTPENEFAAWTSGGFDRWRTGVARVGETHPYAALLISMHAYWLYAVALPDLTPDDVNRRRHFVFGHPEAAQGLVGNTERTRAFLRDVEDMQADLKRVIAQDEKMAAALEPNHLDAHFRLLQLLDSMSLYLSLNDMETHTLPHVPRASWDDPTALTWKRTGPRTIAIDPYPFDTNRLRVTLPARRVADSSPQHAGDSPLSRYLASPLEIVEFTFVRANE